MSICSKDRKYQDLSMCCKSLENDKNMVKRKIRDKHNSQKPRPIKNGNYM